MVHTRAHVSSPLPLSEVQFGAFLDCDNVFSRFVVELVSEPQLQARVLKEAMVVVRPLSLCLSA
eukprot:6473510-Amphidinium_carterae.1